jgi:hypothetical protein
MKANDPPKRAAQQESPTVARSAAMQLGETDDDAVYRIGHGGCVWACECPARGRCAHLVAVELVAPRRAT